MKEYERVTMYMQEIISEGLYAPVFEGRNNKPRAILYLL